MMGSDFFSKWLGIEIVAAVPGSCTLKMRIRREMLNGFGIAHGGISFSLADSALAFASNAKGRKSLSIETSINHVKSLKEGDEVLAVAECVTETEKLGHYRVTVSRPGSAEVVALFKGVVYKTSKDWE
jgi:acyl-CoA thioesterase